MKYGKYIPCVHYKIGKIFRDNSNIGHVVIDFPCPVDGDKNCTNFWSIFEQYVIAKINKQKPLLK